MQRSLRILVPGNGSKAEFRQALAMLAVGVANLAAAMLEAIDIISRNWRSTTSPEGTVAQLIQSHNSYRALVSARLRIS